MITEPRDGDFGVLENIDQIYSETEEILRGYGLIDQNDRLALEAVVELSYLRLLSHVTRQRDVLRENMKMMESLWPETVGLSIDLSRDHVSKGMQGATKEFIDALEGKP